MVVILPCKNRIDLVATFSILLESREWSKKRKNVLFPLPFCRKIGYNRSQIKFEKGRKREDGKKYQ